MHLTSCKGGLAFVLSECHLPQQLHLQLALTFRSDCFVPKTICCCIIVSALFLWIDKEIDVCFGRCLSSHAVEFGDVFHGNTPVTVSHDFLMSRHLPSQEHRTPSASSRAPNCSFLLAFVAPNLCLKNSNPCHLTIPFQLSNLCCLSTVVANSKYH